MITTKEEHQDQRLAGTGLYVDMENLHTEGQALIQGLIDDWPGNTPPPSHLNLYVHADQTKLWRLWASSRFKNMEVRAHGTQHFSSSSSKNSADMAIVAHAMAMSAEFYERFPSGFIFDPIKVYPRTDHMGDDYLKVFIIYDGKMEDLDAAQTVGLITRIKPKVRALNINDYLSDGFVEKSEWENLSKVPLL